MSSMLETWQLTSTTAEPNAPVNWYAVQTRARHEKAVAQRLEEQGISTFLPLVSEVHRWSDRRKRVHLPLFNCYVFAQLACLNESRYQVYRTHGVFGIVGPNGGLAIPEEQIEAVRMLLTQELGWSNHPFLKIGQRVRVRGGSMDGVEGVLVSRNGDRTLVISIDAIQRSLAIRIEGYDVEPI